MLNVSSALRFYLETMHKILHFNHKSGEETIGEDVFYVCVT